MRKVQIMLFNFRRRNVFSTSVSISDLAKVWTDLNVRTDF